MSLKSPYTIQTGRGAYDAVVFKDGDFIVAESDVGSVISEGTNAATVINAGVDSLPASGGKVFLKDFFTITATITIDTAGVILMGDSWGNSGLKTTADIPLITITPDGPKAIIEKMYLEGANDVAKTNNHGIFFSETDPKYDAQLRDLYIVTTYDAINGYNVGLVYLENVRSNLCTHDGIHLDGAATAYSGIYGVDIAMKSYGNTGFYANFFMGGKITNLWLEGDYIGNRGLELYNGFMNWFTNVDCEGHTDHGAIIQSDSAGSSLAGGWFAGNKNGMNCYLSKQLSLSQCYFYLNKDMGLYMSDCERMVITNSFAIDNSQNIAGAYPGFGLNNTVDSILNGVEAYDTQGTKTQDYGIREYGTSDYNIFKNNNLRSNLTLGILTLGAHNSYDSNFKSSIFDLSSGASDIEVFHAMAPCTFVGYQILYTELSSADAGVDVRIGRYQSGVALDNDYFDISTSEVSKNKGYSKFFQTSDLTQKVIAVGDTVTVGTAGGKTGTGEVCVLLMLAEQSD